MPRTITSNTHRQVLTLGNGCRLSYWHWRQPQQSRPVILFIHGLGSNHSRWQELIEQSQLLNSWNVLVPDLCGFGESVQRVPGSMEQWADELNHLLGIEHYAQCIVVGHSFGAHIALHLQQRHPQCIAGLILIDPVRAQNGNVKLRRFWRYRSFVAALCFIISLLNRAGLKRRILPQRDLREWDQAARFLIATGQEKEMLRRYSSILLDLKYNSSANFLRACIEVLRPLPVSEITGPVLLILSSNSDYQGNSDASETTDPLPHVQTKSIHHVPCNHWLLTEKPLEVQAIFKRWLAQTYP